MALVSLLLVLGFAGPAFADDERIGELERKVEALTAEIENIQLGAVADTTARARTAGRFGLAPAASKVYGAGPGVSIGGYGEALYENFDRSREDDVPSGKLDRLDHLRQVVYLGYKFTDRLLFNSEIELEHGGVRDEALVEGRADPLTGEVQGSAELSGEVSLEFAYIDWLLRPEVGVRAGMMLLPLGLVNELHEPPIFLGARRPDVEQVIIPTTWSANGIGIHGRGRGLEYRLFLTEGLNARGFSASQGIREGRQNGSQSLATRGAVAARLDDVGFPGLTAGAAAFTGDSWQDFQPAGAEVTPRLTLFDLHSRLQWRGLTLSGLYAHGALTDVSDLSDALGLTGSDRLGKSFFGGYVEGAYDVAPLLSPAAEWGLAPYARLERYDTQEDVPGGAEDPANRRSVITAGVAFKPHPQVVLKTDRQWRHDEADTATDQWNVAFGYLF